MCAAQGLITMLSIDSVMCPGTRHAWSWYHYVDPEQGRAISESEYSVDHKYETKTVGCSPAV